jgi:hypothetical protein
VGLTVNAPLVARATERQCNNISSTRTSLVSSMPMDTMARLSPTRMMSMPAVSATCALGKSWAVIMVMGSFFLYMDRMVPMVIFFLCGAMEAPMGECELHRRWCCDSADSKGLAAAKGGEGCVPRYKDMAHDRNIGEGIKANFGGDGVGEGGKSLRLWGEAGQMDEEENRADSCSSLGRILDF